MRSRRLAAILAIASLRMVLGCDSSTGGSQTTSSTLLASPVDGSSLVATSGTAYTQVFSVSGWGTAPFTMTAPQGAPAGLTFTTTAGSSTATLSGTPSTAGTGAFELQITDANGRTQTLMYAFRIEASTAGLTLSPTTLPAAISHVLYNQSLTVTGGTQPFAWSISTGTLPPGLTLSSSTSASNAITGTPTTAGVFPFTIQVTDSSSPVEIGSFPLSITVN